MKIEPGQIVGPSFWRARFILREQVEASSPARCPIWLVDEVGGQRTHLRICLSRAAQRLIVPRRLHNIAALAAPDGILDGIRDPFFGPVPQSPDTLPPEGQVCDGDQYAYYVPLRLPRGQTLTQLLQQLREKVSLLEKQRDVDPDAAGLLEDTLAIPLGLSWNLLGPVLEHGFDLLARLQEQAEPLVHGGLTADSVRFWHKHPWEELRLLAAEPACCLPPELAPSNNTGDGLAWVDLISLILFDRPRGTDSAVIEHQANVLADRARLAGDLASADELASAWRSLAVNDLPPLLGELVRSAAAEQRSAAADNVRRSCQRLIATALEPVRERPPVSGDALLTAVLDATVERVQHSLDQLLFHYQHRVSRTWASAEPPDIWAARWTDPEHGNFSELVHAGLFNEAARFASPYLEPVARTIAVAYVRCVFEAAQPGWEPNWEPDPLLHWAPAARSDLDGEPLKRLKVRWQRAVDQQDVDALLAIGLSLLAGGALARLKD